MLDFQHIEYLLGLVVLVPLAALFVAALRWKRKTRQQMGDPELVTALTKDYSPRNYRLKSLFIGLAILFCIVAGANLRRPEAGSTGSMAGVDVMVALDVSNSMLAQDIKPSRLERAKQVLNKIIDKLGNNRLGLVLFAGQSFLQMPLTSDLAAAKLYVSNAGPDAVPVQGTVIAQALKLCNTSLDTKEKKYKAIILISDGEDHDEKTPEAIKELQDAGAVVYAIGIGSPDGATIFDPAENDFKKDENGNTVVSKLNEKDLQMIAQQTGGDYYLFKDADDIANKVTGDINRMDKKQIGGQGLKVYDSYFQWFVLAAFLLLLIEILIPERKMRWLVWKK